MADLEPEQESVQEEVDGAEDEEEEIAGEEAEGEVMEQADAEPADAETEATGEEVEEEGVQPNSTLAQIAETGGNMVKKVGDIIPSSDDSNEAASLYKEASTQLKAALKAAGLD